MEKEYDFSKGMKNPYAAKLKEETTVQVDGEIIAYFKRQAETTGIPYQRLINFYLSDCVKNNRTLCWK